MKSIFGSILFFFFVAYIAYIFYPSDDYQRIQHACSPVNILGTPIQSGERLAKDGKTQSLGFFQKAEHTCQLWVFDMFYAEHK